MPACLALRLELGKIAEHLEPCIAGFQGEILTIGEGQPDHFIGRIVAPGERIEPAVPEGIAIALVFESLVDDIRF
jgi:hypothetical protein